MKLPQFITTDMDNGIFWRSLERYEDGDIIEHAGRNYEVQYSWLWVTIGETKVYVAELEPC